MSDAEAGDRDDEQHPAVAEERAEADERRELRIAVDQRVDHGAARPGDAAQARDAAVEDVERAREDREPAREEDRARARRPRPRAR